MDALTYAHLRAPRDGRVAASLVGEYLRQKNLKAAADALRPIAYRPDLGQSKDNKAYTVLKMIEAGDRDGALKMAEKELLPKEDADYPAQGLEVQCWRADGDPLRRQQRDLILQTPALAAARST